MNCNDCGGFLPRGCECSPFGGRASRATVEGEPAQAVPAGQPQPIELLSVRETVKETGGWWSSCSGCYETEDGHPVGRYPHSEVFGCALGAGCSDCGGIGAVWNHYTDPQIESMFSEAAPPPAGTASDSERLRVVLATFGKREDNMPLTQAERNLLAAFDDRGSYTTGMKLAAIDAAIQSSKVGESQ